MYLIIRKIYVSNTFNMDIDVEEVLIGTVNTHTKAVKAVKFCREATEYRCKGPHRQVSFDFVKLSSFTEQAFEATEKEHQESELVFIR